MVASIWLRPCETEAAPLRELIAALAHEHGTMPFEPHLTVCTIAEPTSAAGDAAAGHIATCRALPLTVRQAGISYSTLVPFRAVVIDVENSPELREFREALQSLTGAGELVRPHISLLYAIAAGGQRISWGNSEERLRAIAEDCRRRLAASRWSLGRPVLVAPAGDWADVASWRTVRRFGPQRH